MSALLLASLLPAGSASAADIQSKAGAVNISSGYLNVRKSASASSAVASTLKKHAFVTLISKSGSWWRVEYDKGSYGYCHEDYITTLSSKAYTVSLSSGSLNVRSGPSTAYAKTGSLSKGETVIGLSYSGEWVRILYHGTKTGYVHSRYLSAGQSSSAVRLSVPSYKQTDPRWANVTIGSSGKTIGRIGCVTTGIAMMKSYRSGSTIYPDAMSKRLSYSSGGNVYWPSDYIVSTSKDGYLSKILSLLKQGKPVLLGAKNSSGGQHWVVITGYTGAGLTESSFIINDPGSETRTNLQQFFGAYPTFYKYFNY